MLIMRTVRVHVYYVNIFTQRYIEMLFLCKNISFAIRRKLHALNVVHWTRLRLD